MSDAIEQAGATHESRQTLWLLALSPAIWIAHLLASYLTVAIWCAKAGRDARLGWTRGAIGAYTALALGGIALVGWRSFRRHSYGTANASHALDTRADRHRFLGFASLLLSGVSAIGVVYVALAAVFMETCR